MRFAIGGTGTPNTYEYSSIDQETWADFMAGRWSENGTATHWFLHNWAGCRCRAQTRRSVLERGDPGRGAGTPAQHGTLAEGHGAVKITGDMPDASVITATSRDSPYDRAAA